MSFHFKSITYPTQFPMSVKDLYCNRPNCYGDWEFTVSKFPYDKEHISKITKEMDQRFQVLQEILISILPIFVLYIPKELIGIICTYTLWFEQVDELFDILDYFLKWKFHLVTDDLWSKLVKADLNKRIGYLPCPSIETIKDKYFYHNGFAWRKTFTFAHTPIGAEYTFAEVVMKRLYNTQSSAIYTKFKSIKEYKGRAPKKEDFVLRSTHYCQTLQLMRMYKKRVKWIQEVVSFICKKEQNEYEILKNFERDSLHRSPDEIAFLARNIQARLQTQTSRTGNTG